MKFRIVASSPRNPGNLIVQEPDGGLHAFVADTGTVTRGTLHHEFFQALLRNGNWRPVEDDTWYSSEELKRRFARRDRRQRSLRAAEA